ncbi:MAG: hypothetical protein RJA52_454, partial [Bacteroidota bacterium]
MQLSEQELIRRDNLNKIREMGINPFPEEAFPVNIHAALIHSQFDHDPDSFQGVILAGRVMMTRVMGKASFGELQDSSGRIQFYISRDEICPGDNKDLYNVLFKKLLDIGDFIGIKGHVFKTQTGEITVHVHSFSFLGKCLRPLPVVKTKKNEETGETEIYDAFADPELRYRMRYVDLTVNQGVKDVFLKRTRLINSMRTFFNEKGWIEVETPILQPVHGGAAARPFSTHHNTLDIPLFLRIANE